MVAAGQITSRVHARVGLLGNPSDGYNGQTISFSLANFWAEVTLTAGAGVSFVPNPVHDATSSSSLQEHHKRCSTQGYGGGVRLLMAACKVFHEHCQGHQVALREDAPGFTLSYDTNIPRQTGLAGSSAIVCAALECLMQHYNVTISRAQQPGLMLAAEAELGIVAGLQDRVIQVYGGVVHMDFDSRIMAVNAGCGAYTPLRTELMPPLYVMYSENPSESGSVHSHVKQRWLAGDHGMRAAMQQVAQCAAQGREALEAHDWDSVATLMDRNFNLRREMFGDVVLGARNLHMIQLARDEGCSAKFTGSGGAIVVYCPAGENQAESLQLKAAAQGFVMILAEVAEARPGV